MNFHIKPISSKSQGLKVIPVQEDLLDQTLQESVGKPINPSLFSGKQDSIFLLESNQDILLLIGLGKTAESHEVETCFRRVLAKNKDLVKDQIILEFPDSCSKKLIESALIGFQLGSYSIGFYKKDKPKDFKDLQVIIKTNHPEIEQILSRVEKIANAKIEGFKLVDLPPNVLTPAYLADWATKWATKPNTKTIIFDQKEAEETGLKAFLAVGRGSAKPPKFIIMEYRHPNAKFHLGLVGKGVTFDTGGLNIKTSGMVDMKSDMGGAAGVLAATQLIAELKLEINLTTIVPSVENAVDKEAYLPSEIIGSHSGLSIEVIDTDAEGRLILADGLSYLVSTYQPDHLLDLATLTGSALGTFGYECGALFSNNEGFSSLLQESGMRSGEKVWPLPIWDSYRSEMDSEMADIKNYHGKPYAGAITAAKFLEAFIHEHPSWAHIDIPGVSFKDSEFAKTKTGTAFGMGLIVDFVEKKIKDYSKP
ncbi:leucyl aminopeptidase family protein [Algoriphagus lutimaris]|uniref:leucyl aminopeptidase family protein n=1 Tax=Algoriphagus lutimaris TaxID=613197 RepID=UPI00196A3238|nr:leucyl aminopeptidase family protein [Algoriphagus lutimaris]MBN3519617.1 leucyl aminopeptidase family protein [Algoriphagus lutimaris]